MKKSASPAARETPRCLKSIAHSLSSSSFFSLQSEGRCSALCTEQRAGEGGVAQPRTLARARAARSGETSSTLRGGRDARLSRGGRRLLRHPQRFGRCELQRRRRALPGFAVQPLSIYKVVCLSFAQTSSSRAPHAHFFGSALITASASFTCAALFSCELNTSSTLPVPSNTYVCRPGKKPKRSAGTPNAARSSAFSSVSSVNGSRCFAFHDACADGGSLRVCQLVVEQNVCPRNANLEMPTTAAPASENTWNESRKEQASAVQPGVSAWWEEERHASQTLPLLQSHAGAAHTRLRVEERLRGTTTAQRGGGERRGARSPPFTHHQRFALEAGQ